MKPLTKQHPKKRASQQIMSAPAAIGKIDFENDAYSWAGVVKTRADLAGNAGGYNFDPANLVSSGYSGEGYFALLNEALAAITAGTIVVLDCTVDSSAVVKCDIADATWSTDLVINRGSAWSSVFDGNGGPEASTPNGEVGRAKAAFLVFPSLQIVSDNGGTAATCSPPVARPEQPTIAGFEVRSGAVVHSLQFYSLEGYVQSLSAA